MNAAMFPAPTDPATPRIAVIVGGGPAGSAVLIAASRAGQLENLAAAGLTVVEAGPALGAGELARFAITGDSSAETFLTAVAPGSGPELHRFAQHPAARDIATRLGPHGGTAVPLPSVASLLDALGEDMGRRIGQAGGHVLTRHRALSARLGPDGLWRTRIAGPDGHEHEITSLSLVLATGGDQCEDRLDSEMLDGESLRSLAGSRLLASRHLLAHGGSDLLAERLRGVSAPRVVVLGSSASAYASCGVVLRAAGAIGLGEGGLTLMHGRKLRMFYASTQAALDDGYTDFGPDDVCPVSGFVYRLAGARMDARILLRQALAIGGSVPDPRLVLCQRPARPDQKEAARLARILRDADLVIHALGYRPRGLAMEDQHGMLRVAAADGHRLVDATCRIRAAGTDDAPGAPLPGLFGIGLGAGFVLSGALGGEPSFDGQANGLWLWQNDAGAMIVQQALDRIGALAASRMSFAE